MSNFCSQCGSKYVDYHRFCTECGAPRKKTSPPPSVQTPTTVQVSSSPIETSNVSQTPINNTAEITLSEWEAREVATSLIYTAGALLPFQLGDGTMSSHPDEDDLDSIFATMSCLDKIFKAFPQINQPHWIGYTEYQKVESYLKAETKHEKMHKSGTIPDHDRIKKAAPVQSQVSQPTAIPKSSTIETVKSTIIDVKTIFPSVYYILFLTDRRIIGARKGVFSSATQAGGSIGGIFGAMIGAGLEKTLYRDKKSMEEALAELSPDQILAYDKNNFEVKYEDINFIELRRPGFLQDVEIKIIEEKRRFEFIFDVEKDEFQVVIDMFNQVISEKVKIK
jgi:hypothetical protein